MKLIILQTDARCSRAFARIAKQEVGEIRSDEIKILPDDQITDKASIIDFIMEHAATLRLIILDPYLRLRPAKLPRNIGDGMKLYKEIVILGFCDIRIIVTSFETRERLAAAIPESSRFLENDWTDWNPCVQLPVMIKETGRVMRELVVEGG